MEVKSEEAYNNDNASGMRSGLAVDGGASRPDDVGYKHSDAAPSEERSPSEAINKERGRDSSSEVEDLQ